MIKISIFLLVFVIATHQQSISAPVDLKVEYIPSPIGVDSPKPRFSWLPSHESGDQVQSAYIIKVGDVWDSGKIKSNQTSQIAYNGKDLSSNTVYDWSVQWFDKDDKASALAKSTFHTGAISNDFFKDAKWIGHQQLHRLSFDLNNTLDSIKNVYAYISGIGYSQLYINGKKISDDLLNPAWTSYDQRVLYSTYVIKNLKQGENVIGVEVGNGWYGQERSHKDKRVLFQLVITLKDGSVIKKVSDETWSSSLGPITYDDVYNGEVYDARLEQPGWDSPNFKQPASWTKSKQVPSPGGVLSSQVMQPVRALKQLLVQTIKKINGNYLIFFDQNFTGWGRLRVKAPAGTKIEIHYSELLHKNKTAIDVSNLRSARATDVYVTRGTGDYEYYEPKFTFHGFQYVWIVGFPGEFTKESFVGKHLYTSVDTVGTFSTSEPILNQIQRLVWWGQTSNLKGIPSDCPQRDERYGWLADAAIVLEESIYNFDMAAFYTKYIRDIFDNQNSGGKGVTISDTVPQSAYGGFPADPAWGTAYPDIATNMWNSFGDVQLLSTYYEPLKRYIDFYSKEADKGLEKMIIKYGDWVPPPPFTRVNGPMTSSFFVIRNLIQMAEFAKVLGKQNDHDAYIARAKQLGAEYHQKFYNKEKQYYDNGFQSAQVFALKLAPYIIPESLVKSVFDYLVNDVINTQKNHLTTGIWGTKYLMEVLSEYGRVDVALGLAKQTTYPSWGYMVVNDVEPATTLWELWNSPTGDVGMDSRNHIMFGCVGGWFYQHLAGITALSPGYGYINLKPAIELLDGLESSYKSVRGEIKVQWSRGVNNDTKLVLQVPVNSVARLQLKSGYELTWDDGKVKDVEHVDGLVHVNLGSGVHIVMIK
ncbi:alpha-L-rhamnosidase [Acrasis kona]|uniref:alpha-L-rhamnosidase n=1 Tax=Acrasis kona TaxID=1008807 RepID=A0AAW2ZMB3_9EUKA